jgi:hypothetical protein
MKSRIILALATCLVASGCDDTKNPLSDPQTSKADERLLGVWREPVTDVERYYHVGHAGKKYPSSVLRVVAVTHRNGIVETPEELLAFPTVIGDKTFLNLVFDPDKKLIKLMDEKGWKAGEVDHYKFLKYQVDGDSLLIYQIDEHAKAKAIENGRIKGVPSRSNPNAPFTDTTENVARFVAETGDNLWITKEPVRYERVSDTSNKPAETQRQK